MIVNRKLKQLAGDFSVLFHKTLEIERFFVYGTPSSCYPKPPNLHGFPGGKPSQFPELHKKLLAHEFLTWLDDQTDFGDVLNLFREKSVFAQYCPEEQSYSVDIRTLHEPGMCLETILYGILAESITIYYACIDADCFVYPNQPTIKAINNKAAQLLSLIESNPYLKLLADNMPNFEKNIKNLIDLEAHIPELTRGSPAIFSVGKKHAHCEREVLVRCMVYRYNQHFGVFKPVKITKKTVMGREVHLRNFEDGSHPILIDRYALSRNQTRHIVHADVISQLLAIIGVKISIKKVGVIAGRYFDELWDRR